MEKGKRIEVSQLPEAMIQHIQSFLSGKEAARTIILSKSWYEAWLTRPNLDFSEFDICRDNAFETMQRYENLNRKIQSLKLLIKDYNSVNNSPAKRLIVKAMKLGATNLDINGKFLLPHEVLESESLVKLSLVRSSIDVQNQKISCSRLKSLRLNRVCIEGNGIWDIISTCPLIEELVLLLCKVMYDNSTRLCRMLALEPLGSGVNDFHKLKVLSLEWVKIGEWFFRDLPKFLCLKEFTLHNCIGYKEIQICSNSLNQIDIFQDNGRTIFRVKLDVPQIRKFKYTSSYVPSIFLKTTSREWESYISFSCVIDSSWIVKLREFLSELSSSKIYLDLSINIPLDDRHAHASYKISLTKPCIVENLKLRIKEPSSVQLALLEDLFWKCRPKFIASGNWFSRFVYNYDVIKFICNTIIKKECENENTHDLEEVNVEVCGDVAWTWSRSLPIKTTNASAYSGWRGKEVCFQLKWGTDNF